MKLEHDLFHSIGIYTTASGTDDKLPQKKTSNAPFKGLFYDTHVGILPLNG